MIKECGAMNVKDTEVNHTSSEKSHEKLKSPRNRHAEVITTTLRF